MKKNAELSNRTGFEIIAGMHNILSKSFIQIKEGKLMASNETIKSLRACLIVIVAVIRGKEVDISEYIEKADKLAKKILT